MSHDKTRPPADGTKPTSKPPERTGRPEGWPTEKGDHNPAAKSAEADDLRTGHATPGDGGDNKIKK
jgi:hypothetical protein